MVNTWTWGNFYYTQPTNFNASVSMTFPWMQTNVFTLTSICMSQTIDVPALEAALPLLNRGKGCGRLVRERRQLLSFCLEGKEERIFKTWKMCFTLWFYILKIQNQMASLHTCKPASMKRIYSCHRCWYWGTLHVHITLKNKTLQRHPGSSFLIKNVHWGLDQLEHGLCSQLVEFALVFGWLDSYISVNLLEQSFYQRKCEQFLHACCTLQ